MQFVKEMQLQKGNRPNAQQIVEYFSIELNDASLNSILAEYPLFKDGKTLKSILTDSMQDPTSDPNILQLKNLAECVHDRCEKKIVLTKFRNSVADFATQCHSAVIPVNTDIEEKDNKLYHVKFVEPPKHEIWHSKMSHNKMMKFVDKYLNDYAKFNIYYFTLKVLATSFDAIDAAHGHTFAAFEAQEDFFKTIDIWKNKKETLTEKDVNVKKLMTIIADEHQRFTEIFGPIRKILTFDEPFFYNEFIEDHPEATQKRLGGVVPEFHQDWSRNLNAAHYLIRFYCQMKTLLEFYRRFLIDRLQDSLECDKILKLNIVTKTLKALLEETESAKVDLDLKLCKQMMLEKGFRSMAFRYFVAKMKNLRFKLYDSEKYGTVYLFETTGSPSNTLVRLYYDGKQFYNIVSDNNFKRLMKAREPRDEDAILFDENYNRVKKLPWDYSTSADWNRFENFFPSSLSSYSPDPGTDILCKMLHERFEVDGNYFDAPDFHFIISTAMFLHLNFGRDSHEAFIVNYLSSIPQSQILDELVLLRIECEFKKQLKASTEILDKLKETVNNRLKIWLVTKLDSAKIDESQLIKVLIMLQHAPLNNTELETMSLEDLIQASNKHELTTLNSEMEKLGDIDYYIIYLRQQGKNDEALALNAILTKKNAVFHIPEKLIAQMCKLIAVSEIKFDAVLFTKLLEAVTENSGITSTGKTQLITDEVQQRQMIANVANSNTYQELFYRRPRSLNSIAKQIQIFGKTGKDNPNLIKKSMDIATILNNGSKETVKLLNQIDGCIFKLHNVRLRNTQKMAVIYALENKRNLLSQVITGEGKSYIVAAIAIIRAKLKYKFVDVITSSPVLAQRDAVEMSDIYEAMGVTVDHNCSENVDERKLAYKAEVVYGVISKFQSDYLLHDFYRKNILGERNRTESCVIVDEVDSMLLDNGNNMLHLSHNVPGMNRLEPLFVHIGKLVCMPTTTDKHDTTFFTQSIRTNVLSDLLGRLQQLDILTLADSEKEKATVPTVWSTLQSAKVLDNEGFLMIATDSDFENQKSKILKLLKKTTTENHTMKILVCIKTVINRPREIEIPRYLIPFVRRHLTEYIENAKRAFFMKQNEAYVVDTDRTGTDSDLTPKVTIIEQHTGVDLPTTQWCGGLQQFIQIKHGCRVDPISLQAVFVSNVTYFKGYNQINGFTGTLGSDADSKTLAKLYDAELIKIPTFKIRQFLEYIPVITESENTWLDALFEQILNQIKAQRSVLVICHSISKVIKIKDALLMRYNDLSDADKAFLVCYKDDNLTVYKREHDTLQVVNRELEPGRLILATNLAGRGSDIKLSESLKGAGGLHVIISFLPENERIEEQAYGRAARCGDPGSGQIIAFSNETSASGKPLRVFDLKLFRDIAECHRLKSLMDHYELNTKVKEAHLSKFKRLHLAAQTQLIECKKGVYDVPSEAEIIYFALLDEWVLWLDSITDVQLEKQKGKLKYFMAKHSVTPIEKAHAWINYPHSLIALAVCRIRQEKTAEADEILNKVIKKFPEFTGDASYYLGIIAQKDVRRVKPIPAMNSDDREWFIKTVCEHAPEMVNQSDALDVDTLNAVRDKLPDSICDIDDAKRIETEDYLLQAIQGFNRCVERKQELGTTISRLQIGPEIVKSKGFQHQTEELNNVYDALTASAYDMMGHPLSFDSFANCINIEEQFKGQRLFLKCLSEGYITEKAVNHNIMDDQCEPLRKKYFLSKHKLQKIFKNMVDDEYRIEVYGRTYLKEDSIRKHCMLPSREVFWELLNSAECYSELEEFYVLNTEDSFGKIDELYSLEPMTPPKASSLRIQLSDFDLSTKQLYNVTDVENAFDTTKLKWLVKMDYLVKDASAVVNREKFDTLGFLPHFDYFTDEDLADWLDIPLHDAEWIVNKLLQNNTLQETYQTCEDVPRKFDNVSLLQQQKRYIYQAVDEFDCSTLPECLQSSVKTFLYYRFSYTFAFTALRRSLDLAVSNPEMKKPIMLAWKPHKDLMKDLIKYGFVHDHKFELRDKSFMEKNVKDSVAAVELQKKPRLFIQPAQLTSTKEYFKHCNVNAAETVQNQVIHHIRHVGVIKNRNLFEFRQKSVLLSRTPLVVPKLVITADFSSNFTAVFLTSLFVTAVFGSMHYFLQSIKAKYSTQKKLESAKERYTRVLQFYSNNEQHNKASVKDCELTKTVIMSINLQRGNLFEKQISCLHQWKPPMAHENSFFNTLQKQKMEMLSKFNDFKLVPRRFVRLVPMFLNQSHNWRLYREAVRDVLIRNKPVLVTKYYETLKKNKIDNGLNDVKVFEDIQNLKVQVKSEETDEVLLTALLCKIFEDATAKMIENMEFESDDIDSHSDSDSDSDSDSCSNSDSGSDPDSDVDSEKADNNRIADDNIDKEKLKAITTFASKMSIYIKNIVDMEFNDIIWRPSLTIFKEYILAVSESSKNHSTEFVEYFEEEVRKKYVMERRNKDLCALQTALYKNS